MVCASCGFLLPEGVPECPYCGAALPTGEPQAPSPAPQPAPHGLGAEPSPGLPPSPRAPAPQPRQAGPAPAEGPGEPWPSAPIDLTAVRSGDEKTALMVLAGMASMAGVMVLLLILFSLGLLLIVIGTLLAALALAEVILHAHIKTNGVRVSATQYPDIYAASVNFCSRMGIEPPEIYVLQHCVWNAFAARFAGRGVVVLLSGAVDSLLLGGRRADLGFLVGHELAHHALGHLDWKHRLAEVLGRMMSPWIAFWYRRHQELSCDQVALACTGDLALCTRAVVNMTVGTTLAAETNVDEAIAQWDRHKGEIFVLLRTLYSPYPHHLWRLANLRRTAERLGLSG